jgi:hypothetical protein
VTSAEWLAYFQTNRGRLPGKPTGNADEIPPPVRVPLVRSLQRFYLGEAGEGRVAREAATARDAALDPSLREAIALYVREEGRHAVEIASVLAWLGAPLPERHWTEALFRRGRRLLGLRTKMLTIASAEIVGVVYYEMLGVRLAPLHAVTSTIAREERMHLAFQSSYFARVAGAGPLTLLRKFVVVAGFASILSCAVAVFSVDHAALLRALGVSRVRFAGACFALALEKVRAAAHGRHHSHAVRSV